MKNNFDDILNVSQLKTLSKIVKLGDETYKELIIEYPEIFGSKYMSDVCGRMRTKLIQMQCEKESQSQNFPFEFNLRKLNFNQLIPELSNGDVIINFGRSSHPDRLPCHSNYKVQLSHNNNLLQRQMVIDTRMNPPYSEVPYYAILAFGGIKDTFAVLQFPEPGYTGIAKSIILPQITILENDEQGNEFIRKKAVLKQEFLKSREEDIS